MTDFKQRYLEFCKPFVESLKDVYKTMLRCELTHEAPKLKSNNIASGDYSALMGINGRYEFGDVKRNFKGSLVISWPKDCYIKSASAMLMEDYTDYNQEISDVGLEICNITMGNAKNILNQLGYFIEMSIPNSIYGANHEINAQKGVVTIVTPFTSPLGNVFVELNYEDFDLK
ncbi:MAG: hypothetical protein COW00_04505 [Bdellovibrio sp. CG12_big_fil_rev_8_21_14_0_65_39_13]|nr:MAG: hypothetical protein COW78_12705 [Bdellovibrio sp. CG22_combo_CG10-13_8_21_14_all_39_27]PIQ61070.1 MAG: hypothetical protein COW00_04505 [Bdellovibrio sp. CG12_big_fil_rev_8_21_14_0_65_39_13]PIR36838.1 MAG: hypothetical protein COV37_01525 [Bdellovibrio sp. CG11_big_fil_rev_8_21_14_0_20_39_38]